MILKEISPVSNLKISDMLAIMEFVPNYIIILGMSDQAVACYTLLRQGPHPKSPRQNLLACIGTEPINLSERL